MIILLIPVLQSNGQIPQLQLLPGSGIQGYPPGETVDPGRLFCMKNTGVMNAGGHGNCPVSEGDAIILSITGLYCNLMYPFMTSFVYMSENDKIMVALIADSDET
jgi:hypothetical protein